MKTCKNFIPFIPLPVIIYYGAVQAGTIQMYVDCIAALVILFLLCNPFGLLDVLAGKLRLCLSLVILLAVAAVQLPTITTYARIWLLAAAVFIILICRVKSGIWKMEEAVKQSPEVDKVLEHLQYSGEFEARDAWSNYGAGETRALLHQIIGIECPENLISSAYMPVYCLAYLHGCLKAEGLQNKLEELEDAQDKLEDMSERLEDLQSDVADLIQANNELTEQSQKYYREARDKERQLAESRELLKAMRQQLETVKSSAPKTQIDRDNEILALVEAGMSLSQIGDKFGLSKSSVHAAKERAKKRREQKTA